jgi:carboxyl-terminal processing protease
MPLRTPWFFVVFPVLLAAQRSPSSSFSRAPSVDRQLVAAGLWAVARYNDAYWDAVRANWDSAFAATVTYTEARPVPGDLQFFHRLRRWGALLNDGQLEILPPAAIANRMARPPLALRGIERRPFILDYVVNDEMRLARPERLAEILAIQGIPAADWIRDSVLPEIAAATDASRWERAVAQMLDGERGTALSLLLRLPGGAERGASVTRSVTPTGHWPLDPPALEADTLPDGAIWVRVGSFAEPDLLGLFDRALGDAAREGPRHRGLILDLREATGGGAEEVGGAGGRGRAYALLSRLIDRPFLTARRRAPQYRLDSLSWISMPSDTIWPPVRQERNAYTGPTAVLCSPRTAGAAEDFLVAFRAGGRGPIIGEPSAGSTGQTAVLPLAGGWRVRLTVSRDAFPDGKEFARTGILPDFPVAVRVEDVLDGRDAVLERARAYLAEAGRQPGPPRPPR